MYQKLMILTLIFLNIVFAQSIPKKTEFEKNWSNPKKFPDHILLNFSDDPSTTVSAVSYTHLTQPTNREV